jgi:hypothetical protein
MSLRVEMSWENKFLCHLAFLPVNLHSSVEVSPMRSGRLRLDLNCIGDDGDPPALDSRMGEQLFHNRNSHRSPSPASSSSSMQPSLRNIDWNDRPYIQNDALDHGPIRAFPICKCIWRTETNAPVISIMGIRVEINRKDFPVSNSIL